MPQAENRAKRARARQTKIGNKIGKPIYNMSAGSMKSLSRNIKKRAEKTLECTCNGDKGGCSKCPSK